VIEATSSKATSAARYPALLLTVFVVIFAVLGIAPAFRQDWLLENLLVFAALAVLIATFKRFRFSDAAYTLLFMFLVLHEIGAHYTYSLVPYDDWGARWLGLTSNEMLGLERNQYDRLIHFAYGALLFLPSMELLQHVAPSRGFWRYLLPMLFIWSHSLFYELVEFAAALAFGGELGTAYLGTQGDVWDAQKDMACAVLGTVLAAAVYRARMRASSRSERSSGFGPSGKESSNVPTTVPPRMPSSMPKRPSATWEIAAAPSCVASNRSKAHGEPPR
jgi:putative membrane protein